MNQMTFAIVVAIILGAGTTIALTIEVVRVKTRGMRPPSQWRGFTLATKRPAAVTPLSAVARG